MCDCTAAWNTPNPAASALWKSKSAPALTWASAASIDAPTSSKLPVKADQQPALRPGGEEAPSDSRKGQLDRGQLDSADSADHSGLGHSAGYYTRDVVASSILKVSEDTFAADPVPEVTMNQVFGNSFPTLSAASVYSNP